MIVILFQVLGVAMDGGLCLSLLVGGTGQGRGGDRCAGTLVPLGEEGRWRRYGRCWDAHLLVHRGAGRRARCCDAFPEPQAAGLQLIAAGCGVDMATRSRTIRRRCRRGSGLIAVEFQVVFVTPPPPADIRRNGLHFGAILRSAGASLLIDGRNAVLRI